MADGSVGRRVSDAGARLLRRPATVTAVSEHGGKQSGVAARSTVAKAYWDENRKGLD